MTLEYFPTPLSVRIRRRLGALVVDNFFRGAAAAGRMLPLARPERHRVEVLPNVPYQAGGAREHHLDVWRPLDRSGPLPVVLYVHGGGFRILSKETHWLFGLIFARRGFVVLNIEYRLAPRHPFPAAASDACAAYRFAVEQAHAFGGDSSRIIVAGESAGANLATTLALAACYRRPEPWARAVFDTAVVPAAVIAACGIYQISNPGRFRRGHALRRLIEDRIVEVGEAYLGARKPADPRELDLADPVVALERGEAPDRPLPPFFAPVGTWDPVEDDTRRLEVALARLGATCEARYYPRELHAFHAFVVRESARRCWRDTFEFLERHVPSIRIRRPDGR